MTYQITGISTVCSAVCSGAHQRKHQTSASLAFVMGNHWWPVDSLHKGPVFPFDDIVMQIIESKQSILLFLTKAVRYVTVTDNVSCIKSIVTPMVDHNGMCFKYMHGWMGHIYMCKVWPLCFEDAHTDVNTIYKRKYNLLTTYIYNIASEYNFRNVKDNSTINSVIPSTWSDRIIYWIPWMYELWWNNITQQ